ncbi:MAG: hypothetical protein ABI142_11250, partial [Bryocella sp.]
MRKRTLIPLLIVLAVLAALAVALFLRKEAPPEAARLLPESDAIIYIQLKPLRAASHFDETPIARSADLQKFIDATGINPERDIDEAAFALHKMPDPKGPNGPVAYSEVFVGHFDGQRLKRYLEQMAAQKETYAGRIIYDIPVEHRTLRVTQLGYDMIGASNMPTAEQVHSMVDRARTSAIGTVGSSLLASHYHDVPLLAQAWGIGRIGLPFAADGHLSVLGLDVPLAANSDLVASLRYSGSIKLRVEELAPDEAEAQRTVDALTTVLGILRGISAAQPPRDEGDTALRAVLESVSVEQKHDHAVLIATATLAQIKAIAAARPAAIPDETTPEEPAPVEALPPAHKSAHKTG